MSNSPSGNLLGPTKYKEKVKYNHARLYLGATLPNYLLLYHEITSAFITALIMTLFSLASYKISSQILALELSSGEVTFSYFKLKA